MNVITVSTNHFLNTSVGCPIAREYISVIVLGHQNK